APSFDIAGLAFDVKLKTRTYLGLQAERLESEVQREIGVFNHDGQTPPAGTPTPVPAPVLPSVTPQTLNYQERSISATVNQLVFDTWSFGASYRYTHSELNTLFSAVAPSSLFSPD